MRLIVNAEEHEHRGDGSLLGLLAEVGAGPADRIATMVNGRVVRQADRSSVHLNEGDAVEILTLMGGG
jgi:thiamine biosynthesis protein ThiS